MIDSMYAILVAINVKPEYRDSFIKAAKGSVRGEPEIYQFQMLVDETDPNRFYFYEIFRDEKANESHWETDAFKAWWNTVEEMFDGETERICTMRTIFPSVTGLEKQKPGQINW